MSTDTASFVDAPRSRAEQEFEAQTYGLYQLHEYAVRLNSLNSLADTLRETIRCAALMTCSARASILLPDATGKLLVPAQALGLPEKNLDQLHIQVDELICGRVFRDNEVFIAGPDAQMPRVCADAVFFGSPPLVSVPIAVESSCVGVLNVAGKMPCSPYSAQDLQLLRCIASTAAVAIQSQRHRQRLDQTRDATLLGLASLAEWRDPETGSHLKRLQASARMVAAVLSTFDGYEEITPDFLDAIYRSVPMHDIGKVGIPDHILLKPGKLDAAEFEVMKSHTRIGADVLSSMAKQIEEDSFLHMACTIARHHHEKFDGSGYPEGLAGRDIPLAARITAVVDIYDALTSDRVYRRAWPHEEGVAYVRELSGNHLDPDAVLAFETCAGEFARIKERLVWRGSKPVSA